MHLYYQEYILDITGTIIYTHTHYTSGSVFGECTTYEIFFLVLIRDDCDTDSEVVLDATWSSDTVEFTTTVPTLLLDLIKSMVRSTITVIDPIRQISKATPRETAEIRAVLYSVPPIVYK